MLAKNYFFVKIIIISTKKAPSKEGAFHKKLQQLKIRFDKAQIFCVEQS